MGIINQRPINCSSWWTVAQFTLTHKVLFSGNCFPSPCPEIKRIEVLKGPASAIYGFNAFDGIINIITKSPEEMRGTTLQFGGGNFGTITASAIQAGTVDRFGYRLSVGTNQNADWTNRSALSFRDYLFNVQTEYAFSSISKLTVSGGLVDSNAWDGPLQQDTVVSLKPSQGYTNVTYQLSDLIIRGYWQRFDAPGVNQFNPLIAPFQNFTTVNGSSATTTLADTYNIDIQHGFRILVHKSADVRNELSPQYPFQQPRHSGQPRKSARLLHSRRFKAR